MPLISAAIAVPLAVLAAGTGKKVERKECGDAESMVVKPFPHAHWKTWGHCEQISLRSLTVEGGNLTLLDDGIAAFDLMANGDGSCAASGPIRAPDFLAGSCGSVCQARQELNAAVDALNAQQVASITQGALINHHSSRLASLETSSIAEAATLGHHATRLTSLEGTSSHHQTRLDDHGGRFPGLETAAVTHGAQINDLRGRVSFIEANPSVPATFAEKVGALETASVTHAATIAQRGADVNALDSRAAETSANVSHLVTAAITHGAQIQSLLAAVSTLEARPIANPEHATQIAAVETSSIAQQAIINAQDAELKQLHSKVAALETTIETQAASILDLQDHVQSLLTYLNLEGGSGSGEGGSGSGSGDGGSGHS